MIGLVRIALSRPYTFVVLALLTLIAGTLAAMRMPVDIFPSIDIPVIAVAWQYTGLPPDQMAGRIDTPFERALTTTVDDIEHIEASSYNTFGIVKIFFHPGANIAIANAQVTAYRADPAQATAAGHQSAAHPQLQRIDRADHPAGAVRQGFERAESGRSGAEYPASATGIGGRRRGAVSLRRQDSPGADRHRSGGAAGARAVGQRRGQCAGRAELDHAGRHAEDRRLRIHAAAQQRAERARRPGQPADKERQRHHHLPARRGARARRLAAADQYRACRR